MLCIVIGYKFREFGLLFVCIVWECRGSWLVRVGKVEMVRNGLVK